MIRNAVDKDDVMQPSKNKDFCTTLLSKFLSVRSVFRKQLSATPLVHEYVDLGLSVKWATCNVGANTPEEYGDYYSWGDIETKSNYNWETYCFNKGGKKNDDVSFNKYNTEERYGYIDSKILLEPNDDVAHVKWGGNWRMPTKEELKELIDNCSWKSTKYKRVLGYKVTSRKEGYKNCSIFLPAVGYRDTSCLYKVGYGCYWSCSLNSHNPDSAWLIELFSNNLFIDDDFRYYGFAVRPVCQ